MRVALVTQWYPPETPGLTAPAMVKALASHSHHVEVLTGVPNYPDGEIYPGYKIRPYQREYLNGVKVHRGALYPSHDKRMLTRAANYMSFAMGATLASTRLSDVDLWLTNGTPATADLPSMVNSAIRKKSAHAMVIQDLWPDTLIQSELGSPRAKSLVARPLGAFCDLSYRSCDAIGVISEGMKSVLEERGVPTEKIHYTPNSVDDSHLLPNVKPTQSSRTSLGLPQGFLFMYAGTFGDAQGLEPLIDAFRSVPEAHLALVGGGVAEKALRDRANGAGNIHFVPRKPLDQVGKYIASSDVQIVSLTNSDLHRATMPSKVQASLAAARPILAHAGGDISAVVAKAAAGLSSNPDRIEETIARVREFISLSPDTLAQMGSSARRFFDATFSHSASSYRLNDLAMAATDHRTAR